MTKLRIKADKMKDLEKFGFVQDNYCRDAYGKNCYRYEFLVVTPTLREISLCSGIDYLNDDKELIKMYDLIKADMVEKVEE